MIQAIVGILCGLGLFYILVDLYAIPYYKTSKAVESISKQQKEKTSGLDVWLKGVAGFFAKHMRLNEFKKAQLQNDLNTAQMNISPEMFKANAIVKSLIIASFAIPVLFILPLLSPIILVLAIALYNNEVRSVSKRIKKVNNSKVVIIFSFLLIIVMLLYTVLNSQILNSKNIEINGNKYVKSEDIIKILDIKDDKNIFRYNINNMEKILLSNKYIDKNC